MTNRGKTAPRNNMKISDLEKPLGLSFPPSRWSLLVARVPWPIEERARTEHHRQPRGHYRVHTVTCLEHQERKSSSAGSCQGEYSLMFPYPVPLQTLVQEVGDELKAGGGIVQHDGQKHDHLHVCLVPGTSCMKPRTLDPVSTSQDPALLAAIWSMTNMKMTRARETPIRWCPSSHWEI